MNFDHYLPDDYQLITLKWIVLCKEMELVYNLESQMLDSKPYETAIVDGQTDDSSIILKYIEDSFKHKIISAGMLNSFIDALQKRVKEENHRSFWRKLLFWQRTEKKVDEKLRNFFIVKEYLLKKIFSLAFKTEQYSADFFLNFKDKKAVRSCNFLDKITKAKISSFIPIKSIAEKVIDSLNQMNSHLFNVLKSEERYLIKLFHQLNNQSRAKDVSIRDYLLQNIFQERPHLNLIPKEEHKRHQLEEMIQDVHNWCIKVKNSDPEGYHVIVGFILQEAITPGNIKWLPLSLEASAGIETVLLNQIYFIQTVSPFLYHRFIVSWAQNFEKYIEQVIKEKNIIIGNDYQKVKKEFNQLKKENKDLWIACFQVLLNSFTHDYGIILLK